MPWPTGETGISGRPAVGHLIRDRWELFVTWGGFVFLSVQKEASGCRITPGIESVELSCRTNRSFFPPEGTDTGLLSLSMCPGEARCQIRLPVVAGGVPAPPCRRRFPCNPALEGGGRAWRLLSWIGCGLQEETYALLERREVWFPERGVVWTVLRGG